MKNSKSAAIMAEAARLMPGGVNSPVRAFKAVGLEPRVIERAQGAYIYDMDGGRYIDYVGSWGPMIMGHAHPDIVRAVTEAAQRGTSFGAPCEDEMLLAKEICERVPAVQMVRMVNSGTEAVMSAVRLARGYTGREDILKFNGCYHGHSDSMLIKAGSGAATLALPDSPGVPADFARHTVCAEYNDMDGVEAAFEQHSLAAVIIEPIAGNMGVVPPKKGFLEFLRDITEQNGALLIFDEVMTGFRVSAGGAAELYGVTPDLITFGKIIGGGLPVGAYGGRRDIMEMISPAGPVYQAGTLSGNPLAMAAGLAALRLLTPELYAHIDGCAAQLEQGLRSAASGKDVTVNRVGSMLCAFFTPHPVTDYVSAKTSDTQRFAAFFKRLLEKGVYPPPSQFEAWFVSAAHNQECLEQTLEAVQTAIDIL